MILPVQTTTKPLSARFSRVTQHADPWEPYRYDPVRYAIEKLRVTPWRGVSKCTCCGRDEHAHPGQVEWLEAYAESMRQQHMPNTLSTRIQREFRIPGGHGTGKTHGASIIANHFFDCFAPCVISIVAPKAEQAKMQVLEEIKQLRRAARLPGRILDREIRPETGTDKHFVRIAVASDEGGRAGERLQGMHAPYQLVIFDETEGIRKKFREPIQSWLSGGRGAIMMLANPRLRTSWFHKCRGEPGVQSLTLSCLWHPNVVQGRVVTPGAVERHYVSSLLHDHAKQVECHDPLRGTFEVPWMPGQAWEPDEIFSFRVLGEAPATVSTRCFVTPLQFDLAKERGGSTAAPW